VAALAAAGRTDLIPRVPMARLVDGERLRVLEGLACDAVWPRASGAGRVFEAAGALLGLTAVNRWEGEAAALLEALAARAPVAVEPWSEVVIGAVDGLPTLPSSSLLAATAARAAEGEDRELVAAGFHATFCRLAAELTARLGWPPGSTVALGGGCLVNRLLGEGLAAGLESQGFEVLLPRALPPGDGGLAYGQAVVAALAAARGVEPRLVDDPSFER
jgi:hydrogenase maturation protein HypF